VMRLFARIRRQTLKPVFAPHGLGYDSTRYLGSNASAIARVKAGLVALALEVGSRLPVDRYCFASDALRSRWCYPADDVDRAS
jgi:hypothetical protein